MRNVSYSFLTQKQARAVFWWKRVQILFLLLVWITTVCFYEPTDAVRAYSGEYLLVLQRESEPIAESTC